MPTTRRANIIDNTLAAVIVVAGLVLVLLLFVGLLAGFKSFQRYQKRADASNQVAINSIKIKQTGQLVLVAKQQAQIRVQNAVGIREAQDEIAKTLTPLYIQFEAIQAQLAMAHSSNHTFMWVPTSSNAVPTIDVPGLASNPTGAGN